LKVTALWDAMPYRLFL